MIQITSTQKREKWIKENGPCNRCGSNENLHVHHIDPSTRIATNIFSINIKDMEEELIGCIVLCHSCHVDIHTEMKRNKVEVEINKKRKTITCSICKKENKLTKGGEICTSCERQIQRLSKIIICKECGLEKHPYTKELCNACYSKLSRKNPNKRRLIICSNCQEEKYHEGKGMCIDCYKKNYYKNQRKNIICNQCGELKPHHSKGLCSKCYMRQKRSQP